MRYVLKLVVLSLTLILFTSACGNGELVYSHNARALINADVASRADLNSDGKIDERDRAELEACVAAWVDVNPDGENNEGDRECY